MMETSKETSKNDKGCFIKGCITLSIVGIILFFGGKMALTYIFEHDRNIASDPSKIASVAHFKLPDYEVIEQNDNMDRGTSAWSSYYWKVKFKDPLNEKSIKKLDKLAKKYSNWTYKPEIKSYCYSDVDEGECNVSISINIEENTASMSYEWWDILF